MKAERQKIYWIIIGALLFNWLFWNEKMALNSLPYDLFYSEFFFPYTQRPGILPR